MVDRERAVNPSNRNKLSQIVASQLGARLWRMSVGLAWMGDARKFDRSCTVNVDPGDVLIRKARPFKSGVEGMSDGIGFMPVKVTSDMVGQTVAVYLAVEDKTGSGRATKEQSAFIRMVRSFGGLAGVARNDADVEAILRGELRD